MKDIDDDQSLRSAKTIGVSTMSTINPSKFSGRASVMLPSTSLSVSAFVVDNSRKEEVDEITGNVVIMSKARRKSARYTKRPQN